MCTQNNMDNTNNIPQNIEYMCVWTPQDIFLKLSGNNFGTLRNPHEYRLFCPSILLLILDWYYLCPPGILKRKIPKGQAKPPCWTTKFSRAVFACLYLFLRHLIVGVTLPRSSQVSGQFSFHSKYSSRVISPARYSCWCTSHSRMKLSTMQSK